MTSQTPDSLAQDLRRLGLRGLEDQLDDFISQATRSRWSVRKCLERLAAIESRDRTERSVQYKLKAARLGSFKPIADFDWNWPQNIDQEAVDRVMSLEFIDKPENIILVAAQGLGKTMLAKNFCHQAVLHGHSALHMTAAEILLDLSKCDNGRDLERRLRHYAHFHVLSIDEIGYLSYDNTAADLLFQLIARRYEKRPVLLTTNLAFKDWNTVFPNAACATALIDRLTHHAEIIPITGKSFRRREAELEGKKKAGRRRAKR